VRPAENSQAELVAVTEDREGGRPIDEPEALGMGIDPELNRIVVTTNTFDQELRRRLAERYGGLVAIAWDPFARPLRNL
jgi:hypothetical protein